MTTMKRRFSAFALLLALPILLGLALGGACGGDVDDAKEAFSGSSTGAGGGGGGGNGSGGNLLEDAGTDSIVALAITPADPVLVVDNGVIPPPITFTATGTTASGQVVSVAGDWSYDRYDIGDVTKGGGVFTATGLLGGKGTLTFKAGQLTATTSATVQLHVTSDPGIDPAVKGAFPGAVDADPSLTLVYPYDQTVFPRGLLGPTVQWNGGGAADTYYVRATSTGYDLEAWATVPAPSRWTFPVLPVDTWRQLTDSTSGPVTLSIQRHDGAKAYLPVTQTWTIAPANLAGTIYYWEVNTGNVLRIKPGDTAPENFLQKPSGVTCVACHSVSKDGSTLVASFHGGYSPWGTFDLATGTNLLATNDSSGFQAISANGQLVLWRHWNDGAFNGTGYLSLSKSNDPTELAQLNPGGGQPSHPAWSGDNTKVAFSVRSDGNGLDFNTSTLWITDVDPQGFTFSATKKLVDNDAAFPTVTFPTFSPDSQWIAFERSTQARSRGAQASIWLTNLDGSTLIPLDRANGTGLLAGDQATATYEPTFNPVAVGGYFWLVIVSERMYGNTLTDTNPASRTKQLWVTAIDASPQPGVDPSHPAFWLPGQELDNNNMRGEWALSPCKKLGEDCTAGFECCDGFCHEDDAGNPICDDKPAGCSNEGEACVTAADCCDPGATCVGGFCSNEPQ
jgi:hypothetical protein